MLTCYFLSIDLDSFPVMVRQDADGTASVERRTAARRSTEYVHDTEIIFIMPSLQMHLKTEHMQGEHEPEDDGMKTDVTANYIYVSTAEALLYQILPDMTYNVFGGTLNPTLLLGLLGVWPCWNAG